jgi:hypothetical protein
MALGEMGPLSKIPYLDKTQMGPDRFLASLTFHDEAWHTWIHVPDHGFMEIQGWPAEAFYFGRKPEHPADLSLTFLDFMANRANFIELKLPFAAIQDDILNLSAAFAKLKLIHDQKELEKAGAHRMAATEVEYILMLCRGMFDFLQEIITKLWQRIELTDPSLKKRQLTKSFADITLHGNEPRTAADIATKFALPDFLAECYVRQAPVFVKIRQFRDNLVHRGQNVQIIFRGENGFVIQRRLGPFLNPNIWRDGEAIENDLVPLLPALALVVQGTLAACEDFALVFATRFTLLDPTVPGMHLFLRGYFNDFFMELIKDADQRVLEGRGLLPAPPSEPDAENGTPNPPAPTD